MADTEESHSVRWAARVLSHVKYSHCHVFFLKKKNQEFECREKIRANWIEVIGLFYSSSLRVLSTLTFKV